MFVRTLVLAAAAMPVAAQSSAAQAGLAASAERQLPALTETYKHLHRNPELSGHEEETAAFVGGELRKLGYTVTEHVGKYEDGTQALGVVAVMENGAGPRLLMRTELDALPVEGKDRPGLRKPCETINAQGQQVSVMHACGHDLHMTVLLGAARELAQRKSEWHGTLMLIGQPAEESVGGAQAMLADHMYERFGRPDFVLSEHDTNDVAAGSIAIKGGPAAGQRYLDQRDHPRHRWAWLRAAVRQRPHRAGRRVCACGANHRQPANRSATACCSDCGHHSRRDEEQYHS